MEAANRNTRDLKNGNLSEKSDEPSDNGVFKTHRNSRQSNQRKDAIDADASFTMPINAGVKTRSVLNAVRRVTRQTNVAVTAKLVFKMAATGLETHTNWRRQKGGGGGTVSSRVKTERSSDEHGNGYGAAATITNKKKLQENY